MRCKAFEATSGSGSIAYSRTSYTGTVQISMKGDGGKRMQVTQNYAARDDVPLTVEGLSRWWK